ncbi:MAG: ribosome biogenesis GTPase Der [Elusimicrobiota bacterium]
MAKFFFFRSLIQMNNVVLLGRPNVGKSSLFNRLSGRRKALVSPMPGMTRDRQYAECRWDRRSFRLIDTGGWLLKAKECTQQFIQKQLALAIKEADLLLFMVDGKEGLHPLDREIVHQLRRVEKPVILVVNKIDNARQENIVYDFYNLGLEPVIGVSASQGRNIDELLNVIIHKLKFDDEEKKIPEQNVIRCLLLGKPNVGKSSLLNAILGEERLVVSPVPGTTRDSIAIEVNHQGRLYSFIDTAGIKRKNKLNSLDGLLRLTTDKALETTDIALALLDGSTRITAGDVKIAGLVWNAGKGLIFLVNKWDLVKNPQERQKEIFTALEQNMGFLPNCPMLLISAKTGRNLEKIFPAIEKVYQQYTKTIEAKVLRNTFSMDVTQKRTAPPTFAIPLSKDIHFSKKRHFENLFREHFGFEGTPIRLRFR